MDFALTVSAAVGIIEEREPKKGGGGMKKNLVMLLAVMLLIFLAGCGKEETPPAPSPDPVEDPSPPIAEQEPDPEPEPYVPAGTNPLTGLPMELEYEDNRPIAVMLNRLTKRTSPTTKSLWKAWKGNRQC